MVRSWWLGPLVFTMAGGGTVWAQSAPERSGTAGANRDRFMTVTEQGKTPCRCRILQTGSLPDGSKVYLVSAVDDGHRITVVQSPRKNDGVVPPTRFYHWTKDNRPPAGVPALLAQDEKAAEALTASEPRPLPVPANLTAADAESHAVKKTLASTNNGIAPANATQPVFASSAATAAEEGSKGKVVDMGPAKGAETSPAAKGQASGGKGAGAGVKGAGAGAGAGGKAASDGTKGAGHGGLGFLSALGGHDGKDGHGGGKGAAAGTKGGGAGTKGADGAGTKGADSAGKGGKGADCDTKGAGHSILGFLGLGHHGSGKAAEAGAGSGGKGAGAGSGGKGAGAGAGAGKAADTAAKGGDGTKGAGHGGFLSALTGHGHDGHGGKAAGAGTKGAGMKGGDGAGAGTGGKAADASKLPRSVADALDPLNRPLEFQRATKEKAEAGETALEKFRKALGIKDKGHAAEAERQPRGFAGREAGRGSMEAAGVTGDFTLGQPFPVMLGTPPAPVPHQVNIPKPPYMAYIPGPEANPYVPQPDVGVAPGYANAFTRTNTSRPIPADFGNPPTVPNAFDTPLPAGPQPTAFTNAPQRVVGMPPGYPQGLPPGMAPGALPGQFNGLPGGAGAPGMSTPLESLSQPKPAPSGLLGRNRSNNKADDGVTNAFTGAPMVAPQPVGIVPLNTPLMGRSNAANPGAHPVQTVSAEVRKVSLDQPIRQLREGLLPSDREKAIEEIGQANLEVHTDGASALLTAAFRDPALTVRLTAIRTLGTKLSKSPQAMGALRALLDDPDARIRAEVEEILQPTAAQLPAPPSAPKALKGGK